ncbi:hypothetical protein HKD37_02G003382 [Glycine soja]
MATFHGCHVSPNHLFARHLFHTATHQQPFLQHPSPSFLHTPHPFVHPTQSLGIDFESTCKRLLCLFGTTTLQIVRTMPTPPSMDSTLPTTTLEHQHTDTSSDLPLP